MHDADQKKLTIRAALPSEARALSDLALRSKAHWGYSREFIEACREELTYTPHQIGSSQMKFFVLHDDAPIGFYALRNVGKREIELDALFVEPREIGKGYGRRLIEHAKAMASSLGAKLMIIQGDPNAERFYLAAGGVLTGTRESDSIPGRFLPTFAITLR